MARRTTAAAQLVEIDPDHPRLADVCVGHATPTAQFLDAFNSGRLHHAWLLQGPRGVGKATFAYQAASFLLADERAEPPGMFAPTAPTTLQGSADDAGRRRVRVGSHADLFTAEPAQPGKQITVEAARGLIQAFQLTAGEGAWRVAIIDAADDLNRSAANILLKLIEEPPARTTILLVAHNPGRLLPTIRSRCARLAFDALPLSDVAAILAARRPEAEPEAAEESVALSGGLPGRALALLDGGGAEVIVGLAKTLTMRRGEGTLLAEAFAGAIAKDAFKHALAGETLLAWFGAAARPPDSAPPAGLTPDLMAIARTANSIGAKPWLDLYDHATHRLNRARAVNLDPQQTLVDILARAQALLARADA